MTTTSLRKSYDILTEKSRNKKFI